MVAGGSTGRDPELPMQLVGRTEVIEGLRRDLEQLPASGPGLVLIEGEAGIGKSALLRHVAARRPDGVAVLWASGEDAEQRLDLGVAEQLLRSADRAEPSRAALGRSGDRPDPLEVGADLVDVVGSLAASGPVLVVVDDAQWADPASIQALTFAYRRLRHEPVLLLLAHRPDSARLEPLLRLVADQRGRREVLGGLTTTEVRELVLARRRIVLSPRAGERLRAHTTGRPVDLVALIDELSGEELASGLEALPAPRSFATLMLGRLAGEAEPVERLVVMVAIFGKAVAVEQLARALAIDGDSGGEDEQVLALVLDRAVERGLVTVEVRRGVPLVDVVHPLLRSAIVHDLQPGRRAALHQRAADVVRDPTRRMVHRLAGGLQPDARLARRAVTMAVERLERGWELAAVDLLIAASQRFPEGSERDDALLAAADALLQGGDADTARELLDRVTTATGKPIELLLRGQLAFLRGDRLEARSAFRSAWDADPESEVGGRAAMRMATIAATSARSDRAKVWARLALARRGLTAADVSDALTMVASAWALDGDLAAGRAEVLEWRDLIGGRAGAEGAQVPLGLLAMWDGDLASACDSFAAALATGPDGAPSLGIATARYCLADACYRLGDWDRALAIAEELASVLDDAGLPLASPMAHAVAAFVLAARGRFDAAGTHLDAGRRASELADDPSSLLWLTVAAARVARAQGRPAEVVEHLVPLADLTAEMALPVGVQPWRADLVEALVAVGSVEAAAAMDALDARLTGGGPHARVGACRARGVLAEALGDERLASEAFRAGLDEDVEASGTFVRARLELAAGSFDRRHGRRSRAAALLGAALERFEELGAAPDAARAQRELDACGLRPRRRSSGSTDELTPAEAAVARLVARGASNREVAAELVVSVKTVETHLGRVYRKLGVRSRAELAARRNLAPDAATPTGG